MRQWLHFMKKYMPAKPTKWGFKVWTLADAHNGYLCLLDMYVGRRKHPSNLGLGYDVVMNLSEPYQYLRHYLYFDNFFTSLPLIEQLARNQTYSCGTFWSNRKGIPPIFRNPGGLPQGQSIKKQRGNTVAGVWRDKRDVRVIPYNCGPVDGHSNQRVPRRSGQPGREIRQVSCPESVVAYHTYMWRSWSGWPEQVVLSSWSGIS